jgi:hypothetical protein
MNACQATSASGAFARLPLFGPDVRRIIAGVLLICLVLFGQQLYGIVTSTGRLDPALRNATDPRNVIVVLDFMPDRFHNERIAEYGVFSGRDGALNRIRLRNVTPANLARLATVAWVARIEPLP